MLLTSADQIPDFSELNEEEEMEFWENHDFAEGVLEGGLHVQEDFYRTIELQRPDQTDEDA